MAGRATTPTPLSGCRRRRSILHGPAIGAPRRLARRTELHQARPQAPPADSRLRRFAAPRRRLPRRRPTPCAAARSRPARVCALVRARRRSRGRRRAGQTTPVDWRAARGTPAARFAAVRRDPRSAPRRTPRWTPAPCTSYAPIPSCTATPPVPHVAIRLADPRNLAVDLDAVQRKSGTLLRTRAFAWFTSSPDRGQTTGRTPRRAASGPQPCEPRSPIWRLIGKSALGSGARRRPGRFRCEMRQRHPADRPGSSPARPGS